MMCYKWETHPALENRMLQRPTFGPDSNMSAVHMCPSLLNTRNGVCDHATVLQSPTCGQDNPRRHSIVWFDGSIVISIALYHEIGVVLCFIIS
eukprot:m.85940 g.85940  ORF g.85940 m.85940 type:complete len:93 (+) comp9648_c0_seq5:1171-1449(+)